MKKLLLFLLTICYCHLPALHATDKSAGVIWNEANTAYRQGQYNTAMDKYNLLLQSGIKSDLLYYNTGNTAYRLHQVGKSILYYERALKLNPGLHEARENLVLAEAKAPNPVTTDNSWGILKFWNAVRYFLGPNGWAFVALLLLITLCTLIYLQKTRPAIYRKAAWALPLSVILLLFSMTFLISEVSERNGSQTGVIMVSQAQVYATSDYSGKTLGNVYEGTVVKLGTKSSGMVHITLTNGVSGWISETALEVV